MSECWWEGHFLGITKTTENQAAFTGDKTNTVQEDRAPLLHTRTSEGDSKGRNRKANFSKSQEMCSRGGVSVSVPHSQFILSGQEAAGALQRTVLKVLHQCLHLYADWDPGLMAG